MPPRSSKHNSSESQDSNQAAAHGRGRARGSRGGSRRARGSSTPTTLIHANGSAEISFQAQVISNVDAQVSVLPTVQEDSTLQEDRPIPDSPSNPFLINEHIENPFTPPASPEGEVFPDPSPSSSVSEIPSPIPHATPQNGGRRTGSAIRSRVASTAHARATPKKVKKGARDVWTFFEDKRDGRFCMFCQHQNSINSTHEVFSFGVDTSTSTLRAHLYSNHIGLWVDSCDQFKIAITAEKAKGPVASYRALKNGDLSMSGPGFASDGRPANLGEYSYDAFVDAITQFIVADDQSLNVVESPHLRRIFMLLRKDLKDTDIPHRTAIRTHITKIWEEHLDALQSELKSAPGTISLTTDLWSDPNLSPFMAVTAHWIETKIMQTPNGAQYALKLRAELIGFHRVPGRHSGEHLAHAFLYILDRISIASKIGWVTLDNASNIEEELHARDIPFDSIDNRIRCFPHIVNLACKAVLSALAKVDYLETSTMSSESDSNQKKDPISTLRSLIRMIRVSSLRRQHFSDIMKTCGIDDLQLLRDVDIRWSSTLYMIERALLLEKPLDIISASQDFMDLNKYRLCEEQWDALAIVREILRVPDAFQQKLSAEKTPTLCNALPSFDAMTEIWKGHQASLGDPFYDIIQDGIDKLDAYHDRIELVPAYTIAMLLNPSMKLRCIPADRHDDAIRLLRRILLPYYEKHRAQSQGSDSAAAATAITVRDGQPIRPTRGVNYTPRRSRAMRGRALRLNSTAHLTADEILGLAQSRTPVNGLDAEIDQYLADSSTGTSSLAYWQEHQISYPTFFMAALDYLAIQESSVPCERVFSSAKETMTDRRNKIQPELMEMLQMLKFSLKGGASLDFSQGTSCGDIIAYLESVMEAEITTPEEINAFIQSLLSSVQ